MDRKEAQSARDALTHSNRRADRVFRKLNSSGASSFVPVASSRTGSSASTTFNTTAIHPPRAVWIPARRTRNNQEIDPMSQPEQRFQRHLSSLQNDRAALNAGRRFIWSCETFGLAGKRLWPSSISALSLFISLQAAMAAAPSAAVKETCGAEIRSICLRPWRLTPDAISACVEENAPKLSPVCQAFWVTASMCQSEMREVCGGLNPFTIKSCLKNQRHEFSQLCQDTLNIE